MKKYLFSLCLLLTGLSASAQSVSIKLTSGSELSFKSSEISEINFIEETPAVPETPTDDGTYHNGHEYVDLGLSVLWATCNVGAEQMSDVGSWFAWGETVNKSLGVLANYKYYAKSTETTTDSQGAEVTNQYTGYTKYVTKSSKGYKGFYDGKTVLDIEDDAAHVNWGGNWRTPTCTETSELYDYCTWTKTTINGRAGYKVTSKKDGYTDKYIFIPFWDGASSSYYMTSETCGDDMSYYMYFYPGRNEYWNRAQYRYDLARVRPVLNK